MSECLRVMLEIIGYTILGIAALSWVATIVYAIKTVRRTQPGVATWSRTTMWNPFNLLLMPGNLTDDGRSCRKKCFLSIAVFLGSVGAMFVVSSIAGI